MFSGGEAILHMVIALFGLIGWAGVVDTLRTGAAQGRRARLIGANLLVFMVMCGALWLADGVRENAYLWLYLHAFGSTALDFGLLRWRRWRLWSGVRLEPGAVRDGPSARRNVISLRESAHNAPATSVRADARRA